MQLLEEKGSQMAFNQMHISREENVPSWDHSRITAVLFNNPIHSLIYRNPDNRNSSRITKRPNNPPLCRTFHHQLPSHPSPQATPPREKLSEGGGQMRDGGIGGPAARCADGWGEVQGPIAAAQIP